MVRTSLGALAERHRLGASLLGVFAACAVILPACGDGGGTQPPVSAPTTMTILVTSAPTTGTVLVGTDRQYTIEVRDALNVVMPAYTTASWTIVGTAGIATITPAGGLAPCLTAGTVSVHAVGPAGPNGTNLTASTSLECVPAPAPDLSITKVGVVSVNQYGVQTVNYSVTITNNGTTPTSGPIILVDSLPSAPAGMLFIGASGGNGNCVAPFPEDVITCTSATPLAAGASFGYGVGVTVPSGGGSVTNCAAVASSGVSGVSVEANLANNRACTTNIVPPAPAPDLTITKTSEVFQNTVTYTLTVKNNGTWASGPFAITDVLPSTPAGVAFSAIAPGPFNCTGQPAGPLVCSYGGFSPNEEHAMAFTMTIPAGGGTITNCASVAQVTTPGFDHPETILTNNNSCITDTVAAGVGNIAIEKDVQPNHAQNFTFTSDQAGIAAFQLDDDADPALSNHKVFQDLPAGSYTFTETQVAGWTLSSIECTPSSSATTNLSTGSVTIALTAGITVDCTFTNTAVVAPATGSITIVKNADPNDAQNFAFATTGSGLSDFLLDDDSDAALPSSKTFTGLATGVPFTVTEVATSGWTLSDITCTQSGAVGAAGASITESALGVAVTLTEGADVVCTFTNTAAPTLTPTDLTLTKVAAVTMNAAGATVITYTITITNLGQTPPAAPIHLIDLLSGFPAGTIYDFASGVGTCTTPTVGSPWDCEVPVANLGQPITIQIIVPTGSATITNCATVSLAGETNTQNNEACVTSTVTPPAPTTGSITIVKDAEPNDAQNFTFTSDKPTIPAFPLDDDADPTLSNQKVFAGLPPGSYTFTETPVSGWNLTGIACTPSDGTTVSALTGAVTIALVAGADVVCTFTNTAAPAPTPTDLTLTKVAAVSMNAAGATVITYTITITNLGQAAPGSTIHLIDLLSGFPAGTYYDFASGVGTCTTPTVGSPWDCEVPVANLGQPITIQIVVPALSGSVTNCARVTLAGESNTANNEACVTNAFAPPATATITIVKDAQPDDAQNFHFTTVGAGMSGFDLDDDADGTLPNSKTFTLAAGGTYTVTEDAVAGWTVPSLQCLVAVPGTTGTFTDQANRTFTISNLEAGAVVTCTFINVK